MKRKYLPIAAVLAAIFVAPNAPRLHAEEDPTVYLRLEYWPFSTRGNAMVEGSSSNVDSGSKVINGDDWGVVMSGEGRNETWGINMDLFFGKQSKDRDLGGGQSVNWDANYAILTMGGFLGLINEEFENERFVRSDAFLGLRSYINSYKLQFNPYDPINNQDRSDYKNWVEPYIGLRLDGKIAPKLGYEIYGDAGGFGIGDASELSVLARASLIWTIYEGFNMIGGYRWFDLETVNENGNAQTELDLRMQGVTLGFEARFQ